MPRYLYKPKYNESIGDVITRTHHKLAGREPAAALRGEFECLLAMIKKRDRKFENLVRDNRRILANKRAIMIERDNLRHQLEALRSGSQPEPSNASDEAELSDDDEFCWWAM